MKKNCKQCAQLFEITDEDLAFLDKLSPVIADQKYPIPPPTLCPDCRRQRRLMFRNERNLYNRKCSLTGKSIISSYSNDVSFPVYDHEAWHGDAWDAMTCGQDYDAGKGFMEQFAGLYARVPRINFMNQASENSDYANYAYRNRNCYLIFGSHYNESCLYGNYIWKCRDCVDGLEVMQSELVYEGVYSDKCYSCNFVEYCFDCSDCSFCYDLVGCRNCLFSSNQRNKQYVVENKQMTKEGYEDYLKKLDFTASSVRKRLIPLYMEVRAAAIKRDMYRKNCENCLGSDIHNAKNIYFGFNAKFIEDCRYVDTQATHVTDSMDLTCIGYDQSELLYECVGNSGNSRALFCNACWHNHDAVYCEQCFDCKDIFGCVGLHHKRYCILNRQYEKEDYEKLLPRIIRSMEKAGEWGEFFPHGMTVYGYDESVAQDYFSMTRGQALQAGFKWKGEDKTNSYTGSKIQVPEKIADTDDGVIKQILACEDCGGNYRIIAQELAFHRKIGIPLPLSCPGCRHNKRMAQRTPRRLFPRDCARCDTAIRTTYPPDSKDRVYCENCYLESVY